MIAWVTKLNKTANETARAESDANDSARLIETYDILVSGRIVCVVRSNYIISLYFP